MLTKYERHLFENLVTVQNLLNDTMDDKDRLASQKEQLEKDKNQYRDYWFKYENETKELRKELEALKASLENEESDEEASDPSIENDLQEAI